MEHWSDALSHCHGKTSFSGARWPKQSGNDVSQKKMIGVFQATMKALLL